MEASCEPLDLAAPRALGHGNVVVPRGDLVRSGGELLERPRDPARVVDDEHTGDGDPDPERERELPEELEPAAAQRRLGLRDDERPRPNTAECHGQRDAEIDRALVWRVERLRLVTRVGGDRQNALRQRRQRPREQPGPAHGRHPEDLVAPEGGLEAVNGDIADTGVLPVEPDDPDGVPLQLRRRVRADVVLEEVNRDERRDHRCEHDAEHEEGRQPEPQ